MEIIDEEHGSILNVNGLNWLGVISLGGGIWMAYKIGDPDRVVKVVKEDES